ncbi:uncharacterized protein LOC114730019 [Neltuma alba]|uniref:uncharacterized protein LOC114730019 n=1 Tax=Neltuma alba TaxID=207710 RepID=UPI0010A315EF|nr:uncharacterized protein LOC114730019 [Prosopis alba]
MHHQKSAVKIGKESLGLSSDSTSAPPLFCPPNLRVQTQFDPQPATTQHNSQSNFSFQGQSVSSFPHFPPNPPPPPPTTRQNHAGNISHHDRFLDNPSASQSPVSSPHKRNTMNQGSSLVSSSMISSSACHNQRPCLRAKSSWPSFSCCSLFANPFAFGSKFQNFKLLTLFRCVRPHRIRFRFLILLSLPYIFFFVSRPRRSLLIDFFSVIGFSAVLFISLNLALPRLPSIRLFLARSLPIKLSSSLSATNSPQPILWSIGSKPESEETTISGPWVQIYSNGDVYEGEFHKGKCSGMGVYHYHLSGRYEGEWIDGKYDGYGVETWARGSRYRGQYRQGLRHGIGIYKFYTGDMYAGEWSNGQCHGCGVHNCNDGSHYIGEFKWGLKHGVGHYHFRNGDIYAGEYFSDKMHGFGVYQFQNGHRYEGAWHEGRRQGFGMYTFRTGETQSGYWQNGMLYESETQIIHVDESPCVANHAKVSKAVQDARCAADRAQSLAKLDEGVNKVVAVANKAANAARVVAVKAVQNRMHHNNNEK